MRTIALGAALALAVHAARRSPPTCRRRPTTPPRRRYSAYSWAGPYLGATLGYEWGDVEQQSDQAVRHRRRHRGRLQLAARQFRLSAARPNSICPAPTTRSRRGSSPIRGSAPCAAAPASPSTTCCIFGTAGLAYGELTADTAGNLSESHTSFGWVAGGGGEVGFTPHWSAKAEWLYLDLADQLTR